MKKTFAAIALGMMLLAAGPAFAKTNPSPEKPPVEEPKKPGSPKTSDFNIIYVEGLGILLAGTAAAAGLYSRRHEE